MSTPRIRVPRSARRGEVVEIRTLLDHPMTSGVSSPAPRDMLASFEARLDGALVFRQEFGNGASPNPYAVFFVRIEATSELAFAWTHEDGRVFEASARIEAT